MAAGGQADMAMPRSVAASGRATRSIARPPAWPPCGPVPRRPQPTGTFEIEPILEAMLDQGSLGHPDAAARRVEPPSEIDVLAGGGSGRRSRAEATPPGQRSSQPTQTSCGCGRCDDERRVRCPNSLARRRCKDRLATRRSHLRRKPPPATAQSTRRQDDIGIHQGDERRLGRLGAEPSCGRNPSPPSDITRKG